MRLALALSLAFALPAFAADLPSPARYAADYDTLLARWRAGLDRAAHPVRALACRLAGEPGSGARSRGRARARAPDGRAPGALSS